MTGANLMVGLPDDLQLAELFEKGESLWSVTGHHPIAISLDDLLTALDFNC
jgi:hypothetical protein